MRASTDPDRLDITARSLSPDARTSNFAWSRPSSASKPVTSERSCKARAPVRSMRNACIGAPPETSTDALPSTCPPAAARQCGGEEPVCERGMHGDRRVAERADVQLGGGELHV